MTVEASTLTLKNIAPKSKPKFDNGPSRIEIQEKHGKNYICIPKALCDQYNIGADWNAFEISRQSGGFFLKVIPKYSSLEAF